MESNRTLEDTLWNAIAANDTFKVKRLLKEGANVRHRYGPWKSVGTLEHLWETVTQYVTHLCLTPEIDFTVDALQYAVSFIHNDPAIVRLLIRFGADVNSRDEQGETPLFWAVMYQNPKAVKQILDSGGDVNATEVNHRSALMLAITHNFVSLAGLLLDRGADREARSSDDWSPLCLAIATKSVRMVALLIARGADIEARAVDGWTPLALARYYRQPRIVSALEQAGAKKVW